MATPEELASFLIKTAVALARLDSTLGADDDSFRELVTCQLINEMPIPNYFADVHEQLLCGADPRGGTVGDVRATSGGLHGGRRSGVLAARGCSCPSPAPSWRRRGRPTLPRRRRSPAANMMKSDDDSTASARLPARWPEQSAG